MQADAASLQRLHDLEQELERARQELQQALAAQGDTERRLRQVGASCAAWVQCRRLF